MLMLPYRSDRLKPNSCPLKNSHWRLKIGPHFSLSDDKLDRENIYDYDQQMLCDTHNFTNFLSCLPIC